MLRYEDGHLFWNKRPRTDFRTERGWRVFVSRFEGKKAGTPHGEGYWTVNVGGVCYLAHRIIYEMHYGPIPPGLDVDHMDRDRRNNRIENLQLATREHNLWNSVPAKGHCLLPGVSFNKKAKKKPYYSRIRMPGRVIQLGTFATPEEAHEAWKRAVKDLRGIHGRTSDLDGPDTRR